jgi:hypothetical protein
MENGECKMENRDAGGLARLPTTELFHFSSSIFHLPFFIFHLSSSIFHLPFVIINCKKWKIENGE